MGGALSRAHAAVGRREDTDELAIVMTLICAPSAAGIESTFSFLRSYGL